MRFASHSWPLARACARGLSLSSRSLKACRRCWVGVIRNSRCGFLWKGGKALVRSSIMNILHHGAFVRHIRVHPVLADEIYDPRADPVIRNRCAVLLKSVQDCLMFSVFVGFDV